jgi:hypothetical protein
VCSKHLRGDSSVVFGDQSFGYHWNVGAWDCAAVECCGVEGHLCGGVDIQRTRRTQTLQKLRLKLNATLKLNYIVDVLGEGHGKVTGSFFAENHIWVRMGRLSMMQNSSSKSLLPSQRISFEAALSQNPKILLQKDWTKCHEFSCIILGFLNPIVFMHYFCCIWLMPSPPRLCDVVEKLWFYCSLSNISKFFLFFSICQQLWCCLCLCFFFFFLGQNLGHSQTKTLHRFEF